jgi:proteasome component ECM29
LIGNELSHSNAEKVWPALERAIGGKTWDGKEKVLEAFVLFAKNGSGLWKKRPDIASQITKVAYKLPLKPSLLGVLVASSR